MTDYIHNYWSDSVFDLSPFFDVRYSMPDILYLFVVK